MSGVSFSLVAAQTEEKAQTQEKGQTLGKAQTQEKWRTQENGSILILVPVIMLASWPLAR